MGKNKRTFEKKRGLLKKKKRTFENIDKVGVKEAEEEDEKAWHKRVERPEGAEAPIEIDCVCVCVCVWSGRRLPSPGFSLGFKVPGLGSRA